MNVFDPVVVVAVSRRSSRGSFEARVAAKPSAADIGKHFKSCGFAVLSCEIEGGMDPNTIHVMVSCAPVLSVRLCGTVFRACTCCFCCV